MDIISLLASFVIGKTYYLQKKSDQSIRELDENVTTLETSVDKINSVQSTILFETEKNKLIDNILILFNLPRIS